MNNMLQTCRCNKLEQKMDMCKIVNEIYARKVGRSVHAQKTCLFLMWKHSFMFLVTLGRPCLS